MHLAEAVIDLRRQSDQVGQGCRRIQRTPQRTRHNHADVVDGKDPRHSLRIAQRRRLDALIKPTHHPFLGIPRGTTMTHQMNKLHWSSMARPTGRSATRAKRVSPQVSGDGAGKTAARVLASDAESPKESMLDTSMVAIPQSTRAEDRRRVYEAAQLSITYDHDLKRAKLHASPDPGGVVEFRTCRRGEFNPKYTLPVERRAEGCMMRDACSWERRDVRVART